MFTTYALGFCRSRPIFVWPRAGSPFLHIFAVFAPNYPYKSNVEKGLNYIFSQASAHPWGGICFAAGGDETYSTGVAMMAIAASRTPGRIVPSGPFVGQT